VSSSNISSYTEMYALLLVSAFLDLLTNVIGNPITYHQHVRGKSYNVSYDHRAITTNGILFHLRGSKCLFNFFDET
jgi:hypothetical protein